MFRPAPRLARVGLQFGIAFLALSAGCSSDPTPQVTDDAGPALCRAHADCDDGAFCNGTEQCMPASAGANAAGCVAGTSPCVGDMICDETARTCGSACPNPDMDGDGHASIACGGDDCDDNDPDRFPGNPETCDDGQGGQHDEDCDPTTFGTTDRDGDGEVSSSCCNMGPTGPNCGTDCDDTTIRRRSGQVEFCDSVDNDCDGRVDEETQDVPWYPDNDGDGFGGVTTPVVSCTPVAGHSLLSTDCDDSNAQVHPAQLDICDLTDNNCNGTIDELPICDAVQLVGIEGGTLTTAATGGGTISVQIPAGALSASTPIAVGEFHPRTLPDLEAGESLVGRPVAISAYDQAFSVPVNVTLPSAGQNLAVLRLDDEDDTTWEVVEATFVGGQALFEADSGGIFVVATKTCTAVTETCDGIDNDCDWLVDEGDVCGPQNEPCGLQTTTWLRSLEDATELFVLGTDAAGAGASQGCYVHAVVNVDSSVALEVGTFAVDATGMGSALVFVTYSFPFQPELSVLHRDGAQRFDQDPPVERSLVLGRDAEQLTLALSGDQRRLTGLPEVIRRLEPATQAGAEDMFRLVNIAILMSQTRVPGFGATGVTMYTVPSDFDGLVAGTYRVAVLTGLTIHTDLTYTGLRDLTDIQVNGNLHTALNLSGGGPASDSLTFTLDHPDNGPAAYTIAYDDLLLVAGYAGGGFHTIDSNGNMYTVDWTLAQDIHVRNVLPVGE